MLIESEHSMARDERDGSETAAEFMAFASCSYGSSNLRVQEPEERPFLILAKSRAP
jgi:hypothetical protein